MDEKIIIKTSKRSRSLRMTITPDGVVVVTKPANVKDSRVLDFIKKHEDWIKKNIAKVKKYPLRLLGIRSRKEYLLYKEKARELVHERLSYFNQYYKFAYNEVRIGNQKSRWGSCSSKKNLNFNYKIVFLPKDLQDYIIVHELCHLKEMNHSYSFWSLVNEQITAPKALRATLRRY